MLNFGNKEFRNLQEQVLKNAQDIETLKGREDLQIVIVNELPEVGNPNYIYLVAKDDGESPDVYNEYIWLEDEERYEKIGGVSIDLTNYVTTDTEQNISGEKTFSATTTNFTDGTYTWKFEMNAVSNKMRWINPYNNIAIEIPQNTDGIKFGQILIPNANNTLDLGSSSYKWRDGYFSGNVYASEFRGSYFGTSGVASYMKGSLFAPDQSGTKDLGNSSLYWRDIYLTGSLKDGANTVSVANIASKVTSTFISGTFDSNGESTIDTEQTGTPEGLFIFTYGNCQCFLRLTAAMINSADVTPIRISCPMIYNGATSLGWLNITKSGYILILKITDGTNHVDSGYSWTLTKTNLI